MKSPDPNSSGLPSLDSVVIRQCMHCGLCLSSCPTYAETALERNSPRGRIALIRGIAERRLPPSRTFAEEMYACLGCLACKSACPAGVDYATIFETARAEIERQGLLDSFSRRRVRGWTMGWLFFSQKRLRFFGRLLYLYQASGLETLARRLGLTRLLPARLRQLEPMAPRIERQFSPQLIREWERPMTVDRRVAVLTGCVQDIALASVNRDTVDVLVANGCEVWTPPDQGCCGSLHAHNGEQEQARELARRNLDLFLPADGNGDELDAIISNAGGCGSHLKHYHWLLKDDPAYAERAQRWDKLVKDVNEFLIEIGFRPPQPQDDSSERPKLTYHDACHLIHGQGISAQPRRLLETLPGFEFVELKDAEWCCGSAGTYSLLHPDTADAMLERKVGHVTSGGATVVAAANPGCLLHLRQGARQRGLDLRIEHPVTLLAEAYRREAEE